MFEFFQAWLVVVGLLVGAAGIALALLPDTASFAGLHRLIDPAFWPAGPDAPAREFRSWAYGVVGGTMAGWGVTIAIVAGQAFGGRQAWAWWAVAGGVAVWFVLDTARSARHRVFANVGINCGLLVAIAIPLAATFRDFF